MLVFAALLALASLVFSIRSVVISLGSEERIEARDDVELPFLSIVVPARNEAHQIEACVRSLLAQQYPRFEVIVVDDRSTDGTGAVVEAIARGDERLRFVRGRALPEGWVGKPWALFQGVEHARGDWLLFTDADTTHEPDAERVAISYALAETIDVLSLLTDQAMVTLAERAALPSILWTIMFGTGSLNDVNDPRKPNALFNGQYVAMSRVAYDCIGGYAAVRGEIAEDLELSRRFKADGRFRVRLVGAAGRVTTRMYRSFGEIWQGFVKNFALGVRGQPLLAYFAVGYFALLSPGLPLALVVALAFGAHLLASVSGAGLIAAIAASEFGMRRARFPHWSGLWLPFGLALMVAIFTTSLVKHATGGVEWRGRRYSAGAERQG